MVATLKMSKALENGKVQFIFRVVQISAEQLVKYKEITGKYYTEDSETGQPLWFTQFYPGSDTVKLMFSSKGDKIYPDRTAMHIAQSICEQTGQNFNDAVIRNLLGARTITPEPKSSEQEK